MSVFPPGLPALFCLSGVAQSALVPSRSEVGQRGWTEPPGRGAGGRGLQRAPGTRPSSHTTGLVPTPCPGETPVSSAQGTPVPWGGLGSRCIPAGSASFLGARVP